MGCDIHLYAEKKIDDKWICINPKVLDRYDEEKPYSKLVLEDYDVGRDYILFGFLANVRTNQPNGFGSPRGFPKDASDELRTVYEGWGVDAHSASYIPLNELNSKFKGDVKISGMMNAAQWKRLKASIDRGKPNWDYLYPHCGRSTEKNMVDFEVFMPVKEQFKYFVVDVISKLLNYTYDYKTKEHDLESVRIVFWFDN
jgi:hypothetical protein